MYIWTPHNKSLKTENNVSKIISVPSVCKTNTLSTNFATRYIVYKRKNTAPVMPMLRMNFYKNMYNLHFFHPPGGTPLKASENTEQQSEPDG